LCNKIARRDYFEQAYLSAPPGRKDYGVLIISRSRKQKLATKNSSDILKKKNRLD
jgi:hypothetical protein